METNGRLQWRSRDGHRSPLDWGRSAGTHRITDGGVRKMNALIVIRRSLPSDLDSFACPGGRLGKVDLTRSTSPPVASEEYPSPIFPLGCWTVWLLDRLVAGPEYRPVTTGHEKGPKRRPPRRQLRPSRPLARSPATSGKSLGLISCSVPVVHNRAKCRRSPEWMSKFCQGGHYQVTERRYLD